MKLGKLRDSDQQVGAAGEGDNSFWKTRWAGSGLASSPTKYPGGGAVGWKATGQYLDSFRRFSLKGYTVPMATCLPMGTGLCYLPTNINMY